MKHVTFEFFIASLISNLNQICQFWKSKSLLQPDNLKNQTLKIVIQRYIPVKEETNWLMRVHWKKDNGFRLYRYSHTHHFNTKESLNYQVLSEIYDNQIVNLDENQLNKKVSKIMKNNYETLCREWLQF